MKSFHQLWANLQANLKPGTEIKNWTAAKGYLGDKMKVVRITSNMIEVEAVNNLEGERLGMLELDAENKQLKNYSKRVRQVAEMALKVFDLMEVEGGLFMTGKIRDLIRKSREQMAAVDE